jgi:hypothetical protein
MPGGAGRLIVAGLVKLGGVHGGQQPLLMVVGQPVGVAGQRFRIAAMADRRDQHTATASTTTAWRPIDRMPLI